MSGEAAYLEFLDPNNHSHKFYDVSVQQETLTIRFGRVRTQGTTQTKTYPTATQAQTEARKRIREKQRKGYQIVNPPIVSTPPAVIATAPSTPSLTQQAASPIQSQASPPTVNPPSSAIAPIRWRFDSGSATFGLAVDADHCWLGNEKGQIFKLDHQGTVLQQYQLPDAVKCIVADDIWIYAGCDNGNVYDLTGKFPYLAYEVEKGVDIFGLAIYDGMLGVSDANGGLTQTDPEGELLWTRLSSGKMGWMLCGDAQGFYHGHSKGVTMYDFATGRQLWHQPTLGKVLFGCQTRDRLYVATSGKQIQCLSKTGAVLEKYPCSASVYACTTDEQGQVLFAADSSAFIYGFSQTGQPLWKVSTGCGSALSMQWFEDRLYIVTNQGVMACMDVHATAPQYLTSSDIRQSSVMACMDVHATAPHSVQTERSPQVATGTQANPQPTSVAATLETTSNPGQGVILECIRQGQQLRIRAVSDGYHADWMVQFPRDLRREGDRYWVETLKEAKQGGFYRSYGDIKRLV
ncbi:MAG: WGR domain-containing protein [Thermosynechococcaceae cyanobacterium]